MTLPPRTAPTETPPAARPASAPAPAHRRPEQQRPAQQRPAQQRPARPGPVQADGRHLSVDGAPWRLRAVTYGSFLARSRDGEPFPSAGQVAADLRAVADAGFNTVRTYTLPPADLLDAAEMLGLRVLVGLHYDDWQVLTGTSMRTTRAVRSAGRRAVDQALARLDGRSCVAAVVVGNEVPGDLVRLHGLRRVESVLADLVARLHAGAPDLLATYASYPTTEYLRVEGQDLALMNVFLDDPRRLRTYLRHLGVQLGDLPLVVGELGVDSYRVGEDEQARLLGAQLDVVDEVGCAGAAVFSLTDEWGVGGYPVQRWAFGLQNAARSPRPAFTAAAEWARRPLRDLRPTWPSLSVVVCAYQEGERLGRCLESLCHLDYPGLDIVVVDDGSTDDTAVVARRFPFRLLQVPHGGLSAARNAGTRAATGDLVAFLDADATCHPDWPYHLALSFDGDPAIVASGGPNLPVREAGLVARAVDLAPGNPVEVLLRADRAEHVPGCNSVFRRSALVEVGGFMPDLLSAGDDVDLCWRLIDAGGVLAFSAAAQVRHERRTSVRAYLRQQRGYGRAERLISGRHPHRFNFWGQATWSSSVYGGPLALPRLLPRVVRYGPAGTAPYQPVTGHRGAGALQVAAVLVLPIMLTLMVSLLLGSWWAPALTASAAAVVALAAYAGAVALGTSISRSEPAPVRVRALAVGLHLLQPLARAHGAWTTRPLPLLTRPGWAGDRLLWLDALHVCLAQQRCGVRRAGPHAPHDLAVTSGPLVRGHLTTAVRWGSMPVVATRFRPRPLGVAGTGAAAALLVVLDRPPVVVVAAAAGIAVVMAAVEVTLLRQRLLRAVAQSTAHPGEDA